MENILIPTLSAAIKEIPGVMREMVGIVPCIPEPGGQQGNLLIAHCLFNKIDMKQGKVDLIKWLRLQAYLIFSAIKSKIIDFKTITVIGISIRSNEVGANALVYACDMLSQPMLNMADITFEIFLKGLSKEFSHFDEINAVLLER